VSLPEQAEASVVLRFAREGAFVVGSDVSVESAEETVRLVRTSGGRMVSLQPAELSTMRDCQRVVDLAMREFGRIDVLFNNAAMAHFLPWREQGREELGKPRHPESCALVKMCRQWVKRKMYYPR
jgi:NAD(P)-dependent dehydrogenase (short-subunit alcohol dehydrogenase family)